MNQLECTSFTKLAYACWPHVEITDDIIAAFYLAFSDTDVSIAGEGLKSCLQDPARNFPPTPPEIWKEIKNAARKKAAAKRIAAPKDEAPSAEYVKRCREKFPHLFSVTNTKEKA